MLVNPTPHLFWITSRAAGFAALILASLAVSIGLLMSTKLVKGRATELRAAHDTLALATIVAIVVHGVSLLGDQYLKASVADIAIPFVSSYKTIWTSLGIVGGWSLILLGLSYYARRQIGAVRWRKLHRFTALAWIIGLAHALGEGTDAGQLWFLAMLALVAVPALALLGTRLVRAGRASPVLERTAAPAEPRDVPREPAASTPTPTNLRDLPARGVVPPRSPVGAASGGG
jgi:methionine sulfoxide reductase heme-binding subunit